MFARLTVLVLIFVLLLSLGACGEKQGNGERLNIVIGNPEQDSGSDSGKDPGPDTGSDADVTGEDPGPAGSDGDGQDISWAPLKEDLLLSLPEFEDFIEWFPIPKDYIGGLGSVVVPDAEVKDYVNVREKPSINAKVIGKMYHENEDENLWVRVDDFYRDKDQLFIGIYYVEADDYTWIPVTNGNGRGSVQGWVALEKVELLGF